MNADEAHKLLAAAQPQAFKTLAEIAGGSSKTSRKAAAELKRRLPQLRELCRDPALTADVRRDLEEILRKFS